MLNVVRRLAHILQPEPDISAEALSAYFQKLPDSIQVHWERSDALIVGQVVAGEFTFVTQGRNAGDFVEMVHDAVYTVFDIPDEYRRFMKAYTPPEEVRKKLGDYSVRRAEAALSKARM